MEDMLRRGLLEPRVPDETHAVRIVRGFRIFVVARHQELGEDGGPVHRGDHAVLGPPLVREAAIERQFNSSA